MRNFIIVICTLMICASCQMDPVITEETRYLSEDSKNWATDDLIGDSLIMITENDDTVSLQMESNIKDMAESSFRNFKGDIHITRTEYYRQQYITSGWNSVFRQIIAATPSDFGDFIEILIRSESIGKPAPQTEFSYDLERGVLTRVVHNIYGDSLGFYYYEYKNEHDEIFSVVETMDTLIVNGKYYEDILFFKFDDFNEDWEEATVT